MHDSDAYPLDAFRSALRNDVDADAVRPLTEYLARFPGADDAIAREFLAIRDATARISGGSKRTKTTAADRGGSSGGSSAACDDLVRVGPYRIVRELNRGGQGVVYLAEDERVGRFVALKVLTDQSRNVPEALERFRREATVASKLDHPGICPIFDVGMEGATPYLAMKLVPGESLSHKISTAKARSSGRTAAKSTVVELSTVAEDAGEGGPPPNTSAEVERVLRFVENAARALHAAHEAGVVHRDVKPGNIMATPTGDPVILDFGLANRQDDDAPALTQTGDVLGTPLYMSPEQIAGRPHRLDRRTDVYSLGVTLYECLTLRRPFEEPTREGLYQAILTKDPPDVRRLNPSISNDLRVVVEAAMEKDRDRRYATAHDFAEELRRVRMREPIHAKPAGAIVRLVRWSQRRPALASSLFGLFFALSAGLATSLLLLEKRDEALLEKNEALGQATAERNAKSAALADYDRLGDVSRLSRLTMEAESLWPAEPTKIAAMRRWLDEAEELAQNVAGHRAVRDALRASADALPYTDADRATDAARLRPVVERKVAAAKARDELAAAATAGVPPTASRAAAGPTSRAESRPTIEDRRTALAQLDAELATLEERFKERLTWRFGPESAQFKHDTIGRLVEDLAVFLDPDPFVGAVASVKKRLKFAETVEQETLRKPADQWAAARASIADPAQCPQYGGLQLAPQLGLIPIRKDPQSGLWEFAHLETTAAGVDPIPAVRADGRYELRGTTGLIFVLIPGGTFQMGARRPTAVEREDAAEGELLPPNVDPFADPEEDPIHPVTLEPYFLSKYEMTQGQWTRLVGKNPSIHRPGERVGGKPQTPLNPVEHMRWEDCAGKPGWILRLGLALPTEAQWEYACRAETTTPWWTGDRKATLAAGANLADLYFRQNGGPPNWGYEAWSDGQAVHAPVGSLAPNAFGLHDMAGNVYEWCLDGFAVYSGENWRKGDGLRQAGPAPPHRVYRGGAFSSDALDARSSARARTAPEFQSGNLGVRPSKGVEP